MICLHCGDCCTRFEIPEVEKIAGVPCKHLTAKMLCAIYTDRPEVCKRHDYPASVCPIGMETFARKGWNVGITLNKKLEEEIK